ncbi:hypothetical protein RIF29_39345 [Crotalaria pallida]|uniref:NB-ARC domain-containing protein n=1 Tax=Crotalaria pallida TaxID=3830 RepID=A0AAN9E7B4_CROPI
MRGVGKTALAQAVLGDERIIKSFSPNMWVSFPHTFDFDIEQIIIEMINSSRFLESPYQYHLIRKGQLQTAQLLECLEKRVAGKKLLLVLDNVCMEDPFEWDEFMNLIPAGANGSKILLTTRSHSIASMTGTIPSHNLEPFSPEDSLFLFQKCATKAKSFNNPESFRSQKNLKGIRIMWSHGMELNIPLKRLRTLWFRLPIQFPYKVGESKGRGKRFGGRLEERGSFNNPESFGSQKNLKAIRVMWSHGMELNIPLKRLLTLWFRSFYSALRYNPDTLFSIPKAYVKIDFHCLHAGNSPEAEVLACIFTKLLMDYLYEYGCRFILSHRSLRWFPGNGNQGVPEFKV